MRERPCRAAEVEVEPAIRRDDQIAFLRDSMVPERRQVQQVTGFELDCHRAGVLKARVEVGIGRSRIDWDPRHRVGIYVLDRPRALRSGVTAVLEVALCDRELDR